MSLFISERSRPTRVSTFRVILSGFLIVLLVVLLVTLL